MLLEAASYLLLLLLRLLPQQPLQEVASAVQLSR
jgi:hypothetical protein